MRIDGTLVTQRHFGTRTFTGAGDDRRLMLRTSGSQGVLLWKHPFRADDLTVPDI